MSVTQPTVAYFSIEIGLKSARPTGRIPDSPDIICPNEITFQNGSLKYLGGLRHGDG